MGETHLKQIIRESILLERSVGELYRLFNKLFPRDAYFWWELSEEEENHAKLIEKVTKSDIFPEEEMAKLFAPSLENLKESNKAIQSLIENYKVSPPSRDTALNVALKLELTAGELHFQKFMNRKNNNNVFGLLLRQLNQDDKDHATRILAYMSINDISTADIPLV